MEFMTKDSSLVHKAPTHVYSSISAPVSDPCFIQPLFQLQSQHINENPGLASGSSSAVSSPEMDAWKSNPYLYMFNSSNHKALLNVKGLTNLTSLV